MQYKIILSKKKYLSKLTGSFYVFSKLSKLELLEELNLSGNKLKTIPSTVSSCKRLHTLIAHSNHITVFPEILNLPEIKVRTVLILLALSVFV